MKKNIVIINLFVFVFIILITCILFSLFFSPQLFSKVEIHLNFYNYFTKNPIKELKINFFINTNEKDFLILSDVSDNDGKIVYTISLKEYDIKPSAKSISISGVWALIKIIGEDEFSVNNDRWTIRDLESFFSNSSEYFFNNVNFQRIRSGPTLIFKLDFYLAEAVIIEVYDPISQARGLDSHLRINILESNFIKCVWNNHVFVVSPTTMQVSLDVKYVIYNTQPLSFRVSIVVNIGNRSFVDLTPYYVKAFSHSLIEELDRIVNNLNSYGFDLTTYKNELNRIRKYFELAIERLESNDIVSFQRHIQFAMNSCRDLSLEIIGMYTSGVVWIPSLFIIFVFFAISLSKIVVEKNFVILFLIILAAIFCLFVLTNPYLRLFVFDPMVLAQSFTQSLIFQFFFQLLPIVLLIVAACFSQIRTFMWEVFEVSIRNLKRRKLKTSLALTTLIIVTTSAMCLLTIAARRPTLVVANQNTIPIVDRGFVIYKVISQRPFSSEKEPTKLFIPLQWYEVEWLLEHEYVEFINVYGIKKIGLARADGFVIDGFNQFNLIVTNTTFIDCYQNVSDTLGIKWFTSTDKNMVIIGSKIAEKYNLQTGSEVLIDGKRYVIKSIVDEKLAAQNLKEIDGSLFLFKVYDQETGKVDGDSFIIGDIDDFDHNSITVFRVSIIVNRQFVQNMNQITEEILDFGLDFGESDEYSYVESYLLQVIMQHTVYHVEADLPSTFIFGETPIVPMIIAILILLVNMMGTVYERKSEIRTIHVIGASPLRISLIFVTEGLIFGVIGGIFSYIFGFLAVQTTNITLPELVSKNIIGGAPFAIAFSIAILSSLIGCFYPAMQSMKVVVPSGRMRHQSKDIVKIHGSLAHLQVPIKIEKSEIEKFGSYLENLSREVKLLYKFISISPPCIEKTNGITVFSITTEMSVKGYETAIFQIQIIVTSENNLNVIIQPLDSKKVKTETWSRIHKDNINELSQFLREKILEFKISEKNLNFTI